MTRLTPLFLVLLLFPGPVFGAAIGVEEQSAALAVAATVPLDVEGKTGGEQKASNSVVAPAVKRQRLAATLFGETVGEVMLTLVEKPRESTLSYRSDLTVIRDSVRLRQQSHIVARFDSATGAVLDTSARRCTTPESTPAVEPASTRSSRRGSERAPLADGDACSETVPPIGSNPTGFVPALAAELILARAADGLTAGARIENRCIDIVDEVSGQQGTACAQVSASKDGAVILNGHKLGQPFQARVRDDLLEYFEAPTQGALFTKASGPVIRSGADLFSDPVPSSGNVLPGLHHGRLTLRVQAPGDVLDRLDLSAPGHRAIHRDGSSTLLELRQISPPRNRTAARTLAHAALLVAKARGGHVDCQEATRWFIEQARQRGWKVEPVVGIAWVQGRFAFHSWAILEVDGVRVPVDPLLAQVPADAGHLQFEGDAGTVFLSARRSVHLQVVNSISASTESATTNE